MRLSLLRKLGLNGCPRLGIRGKRLTFKKMKDKLNINLIRKILEENNKGISKIR